MRKRTKLTDLTMTIEPQNENPSPAHYENNPEQSSSLFSSRFKRLSFSGSRSKRFFNPGSCVLKKTIKCQGQEIIITPHTCLTLAGILCLLIEEAPGPSSILPSGSPNWTKSQEQVNWYLARDHIGNPRNLVSTMEMSTAPCTRLPKDYFRKDEYFLKIPL